LVDNVTSSKEADENGMAKWEKVYWIVGDR
jgi:hypothetical protein